MFNSIKYSSITFLLSSTLALIIAYILEYLFNMLPCSLCTYERIVFYIVILISLACLFKANKILIYMMFLSYIVGSIISFYHIGLEFHWFDDMIGCTEKIGKNISIQELKDTLMNTDMVPSCDRPYYIFGVSLATWNLIYLLISLFITSQVYTKRQKSIFNKKFIDKKSNM